MIPAQLPPPPAPVPVSRRCRYVTREGVRLELELERAMPGRMWIARRLDTGAEFFVHETNLKPC
jgi:hypothetical protein